MRFYSVVILVVFGIVWLGCGSDDSVEEDISVSIVEDTSASFEGKWENIGVNDKTPIAFFQQIIGDKFTKVLTANQKVVFASDGLLGTLFEDKSFTMRMLIGETQGTPIYLISSIQSTIKGYYVFSSSTVKCIPLKDSLTLEIDFSLDVPKHPELKQKLEQILGLEEFEKEIETELELNLVDFGLQRAVYRYDLEEDILTLTYDDALSKDELSDELLELVPNEMFEMIPDELLRPEFVYRRI